MALDKLHSDFIASQKMVYEPRGWECKNIRKEVESAEYGACSFDMNNQHIIFRVGKITPTKIGQFVTLWKRIGKGPIMPYDTADQFDFFVVAVRNKNRLGQFVFPKNVLREKGIISQYGKGGKRAMRLYPSWDIADNPQAKKTQTWQLHYFVEINFESSIDDYALKKLFFSVDG
jgi:hypothetical protein